MQHLFSGSQSHNSLFGYACAVLTQTDLLLSLPVSTEKNWSKCAYRFYDQICFVVLSSTVRNSANWFSNNCHCSVISASSKWHCTHAVPIPTYLNRNHGYWSWSTNMLEWRLTLLEIWMPLWPWHLLFGLQRSVPKILLEAVQEVIHL